MQTVKKKVVTRPTNTEMYNMSEQVGKPVKYIFVYLFIAVFSTMMVIQHLSTLVSCPRLLDMVAFAGSMALFVGSISALPFVIWFSKNAWLPETITDEETVVVPSEENIRDIPVFSGNNADMLTMYQQGKRAGDVFFPTRIIGKVNQLGLWPNRGFWTKHDTWANTGFTAWNNRKYTENTQKLCDSGHLVRTTQNSFNLTELGNEFFNIT